MGIKRPGREGAMDDLRRTLLQDLIDRLNYSFRAADIIPLKADDKVEDRRLNDDANNHVPHRIAHNKFMRVGDKEIERGQAMGHFRIKNQRIQCDIQFNYAGGDWEVVKDTLEVLRAGVAGIRLRGTPLVTDKLLSSLMSEFPLISTVKIDTTDELCNQLTERGLSELLNSNRLELFHSNNCVELEGLQASTTRLRKLSLTGLTHKCGQIMLRAPHLRRIEIQFSDARAGPVLGLSLSVAQAAARLEHIYVYLPSLTAEEVEQMQLDQMPRLRKLSLSVELTATLLEGSL